MMGRAISPHFTGLFAVRMNFLIPANIKMLIIPLNNGETNHDSTIEPRNRVIKVKINVVEP
jgi:hypothetical protein